jgi:hypothetical protein
MNRQTQVHKPVHLRKLVLRHRLVHKLERVQEEVQELQELHELAHEHDGDDGWKIQRHGGHGVDAEYVYTTPPSCSSHTSRGRQHGGGVEASLWSWERKCPSISAFQPWRFRPR